MQNILESLTLAQENYAGSYMGILRYAYRYSAPYYFCAASCPS